MAPRSMKIAASVLVLLMVLLGPLAAGPASALDPARGIGQFKHTAWRSERGAPPSITAIDQSADGFLWLGTGQGLYRFDGLTFEQIAPIVGDRSRSTQVTAVLAARSGDIWVGYNWGGLAVYRNGRLLDANHGPPTGSVVRIAEAPDGAIWVGTDGIRFAQISRYKDGKWQDSGESLGLARETMSDMSFSRDGALWVAFYESADILRPGARRFEHLPHAIHGAAYLGEDGAGRMWVSDDLGVRALGGGAGALRPSPASPAAPTTAVGTCLGFDRDGNLFSCKPHDGLGWLRRTDLSPSGTPISRMEAFGEKQGLTANEAHAIFEDREGNLWVGTALGLDQFRWANLVTERADLPVNNWSTQMAQDSRGGLFGSDDVRLLAFPSHGSPRTIATLSKPIRALCSDRAGGLWVATFETIHHWANGRMSLIRTPLHWSGLGLIAACAVDETGDLWLSVAERGLFRLHGGVWRQVELDPDRPGRWVLGFHSDPQGRLIVSLSLKRLLRLEGGKVADSWPVQDVGVGFVRTVLATSDRLLVGGENGIAELDGRSSRVISRDGKPWLTGISAILRTPAGDTWLSGAEGVVRVRTSDLDAAFGRPDQPLAHELFDQGDGLQGTVMDDGLFEGALGDDGRLWFQNNYGRAWIDPGHLHRNPLPPPVVIKSITANNKAYQPAAGLKLPQGVTSLQVDYTALSLTVPERVRFRYRLEGVDKDWIDPGTRRQAFYTNLRPGDYRFQVIAASNDGVWNKTGAMLDFRIRPAFWQTPVFIALAILPGLGLIWLLYTLRLRQMTQRIQVRLEDRLGERERIARDLHDTLLQGFQGLLMRFQSVTDQMPPEQPARKLMEQALDRADEVLVEGRDRVRSLRAVEVSGELPDLVEAAAHRLRHDSKVEIHMAVLGSPRPVHPLVCDEVLNLASEAFFNVFKHAQAGRLDIEISYERGELRLCIRDDGVGIDPAILEPGGRPGHYGLTGMRERARKLHGQLMIRRPGAGGTEIVLVVPGNVAYARAGRRWALFAPRSLELET